MATFGKRKPEAFNGFHQFVNAEDGTLYGSFEVFRDGPDIPKWGGEPRNFNADGTPVEEGWYWWACSPGCMPDTGEAEGPYPTAEGAYLAAIGE